MCFPFPPAAAVLPEWRRATVPAGWCLGERNRNGRECLFLDFDLKVNCRTEGKSEANPPKYPLSAVQPRYWGKD